MISLAHGAISSINAHHTRLVNYFRSIWSVRKLLLFYANIFWRIFTRRKKTRELRYNLRSFKALVVDFWELLQTLSCGHRSTRDWLQVFLWSLLSSCQNGSHMWLQPNHPGNVSQSVLRSGWIWRVLNLSQILIFMLSSHQGEYQSCSAQRSRRSCLEW